MFVARSWMLGLATAVAFVGVAFAQDSLDPKTRQELKRVPLTGTNMEVVISVVENKPGDVIPRHIHHGEEAFYVLEGTTVETADGKQIKFPAGFAAVNARDMPHAGLKIVGDTPLKYLAVHIVDKGKPLYDAPPK